MRPPLDTNLIDVRTVAFAAWPLTAFRRNDSTQSVS
jgi:hypothetical protein